MTRFIRVCFTLCICFTILSLNNCSESSTEPNDDAGFTHPDPLNFESSQTVLTPGPGGSWDDRKVQYPSVLLDGDTLRMWYAANSEADRTYKIGYAWSLDGIQWTKYDANPVLTKTYGWEGADISQPVVIKDNNVFKMWYQGCDGWPIVVGYATSTDGKTWTKHPAPVMEREAGTFTESYIGLWTVLKENTEFHGWYWGIKGDIVTGTGCIGYATSTDGISWDQHGVCLSHAEEGCWDAVNVASPVVVKSQFCYEMVYGGGDGSGKWEIGYASSEDGLNWLRCNANPIISDPGPIYGGYYDLGTGICDWPSAGDYHFWYMHNTEYTSEIKYTRVTRKTEWGPPNDLLSNSH